MRLRFTYRAATDLQRLRAFIANDNPPAARRQIDALL
ncbi:type II toxin-antitoxin system RelE/ParE family toxin [Hydrocarboniphaga sp.]